MSIHCPLLDQWWYYEVLIIKKGKLAYRKHFFSQTKDHFETQHRTMTENITIPQKTQVSTAFKFKIYITVYISRLTSHSNRTVALRNNVFSHPASLK